MSGGNCTPAAFLRARRFALVGASRGGRRFGNTLLREMLRRGLSVVPVHAQVAEVEGQACVPSLGALPQPVEAVVLCVPPVHVPPLLHEAVAAGIPRVWLQQGCATAESVRLGHELGLEIVAGQCLLMHLEPVSGAHAFHRWLWRVLGKLPRDS